MEKNGEEINEVVGMKENENLISEEKNIEKNDDEKKKSVAKEVEEEGNTVEPEDDYFASNHLLFTKISAAFQAVFCPWEKVDFVFF